MNTTNKEKTEKILTENQKLNERLLKFAGFTWHEKREYVHGYLMHGGSWEEGHWDYQGQCHYELVNGKTGCLGKEHPEHLFDSLDACFKWLVPKGYLKFGEDAMLSIMTDWIQETLIHGYATAFRDSAERFCIAFGKLISEKLV
jgi:hypothetical protein